jgi:hypothetical protein
MSAETIPDEIVETARWIAADQCGADDQCAFPGPCSCRDQIAKAIHDAVMAEMERCWAIANAAYRANATGSGFDSQPARATAYEIREAIRPAVPKAEGK